MNESRSWNFRLIYDPSVVWYLSEDLLDESRHNLDQFPSEIRFHLFQQFLAVSIDKQVERGNWKQKDNVRPVRSTLPYVIVNS